MIAKEINYGKKWGGNLSPFFVQASTWKDEYKQFILI